MAIEKAQCRSCGADILWVRNAGGNLQPLDAKPNPAGNVVLKADIAHVMKGDLFEEMMDGPRYMPHHATCPDAKKYRKATKR